MMNLTFFSLQNPATPSNKNFGKLREGKAEKPSLDSQFICQQNIVFCHQFERIGQRNNDLFRCKVKQY